MQNKKKKWNVKRGAGGNFYFLFLWTAEMSSSPINFYGLFKKQTIRRRCVTTYIKN